MVRMRKRLVAQAGARMRQDVTAELDLIDEELVHDREPE